MSQETDQAAFEGTFGARAVGLKFNPSNDVPTMQIKEASAKLINILNDYRNATTDTEQKRMLSIAITEVQTGQMWGVKGVTWLLGQK